MEKYLTGSKEIDNDNNDNKTHQSFIALSLLQEIFADSLRLRLNTFDYEYFCCPRRSWLIKASESLRSIGIQSRTPKVEDNLQLFITTCRLNNSPSHLLIFYERVIVLQQVIARVKRLH